MPELANSPPIRSLDSSTAILANPTITMPGALREVTFYVRNTTIDIQRKILLTLEL